MVEHLQLTSFRSLFRRCGSLLEDSPFGLNRSIQLRRPRASISSFLLHSKLLEGNKKCENSVDRTVKSAVVQIENKMLKIQSQ